MRITSRTLLLIAMISSVLIASACSADDASPTSSPTSPPDSPSTASPVPTTSVPPATATPAPDALVTSYNEARARWNAAAIQDYRFTLQRSCECPPEWSAPTEVVVRAGLVASATLEDGTPAPEGAALTIDAILDAIASALNEPVTTAVSYDAELGYPLDVQLDLEAIAVDGGLSLTVSGFERLD